MATIVIPFRGSLGKTRLSALPEEARAELAYAMFCDVYEACSAVGRTLVAARPDGQGEAVAEALRSVSGPVAVVNADVPCVTRADVELLLRSAPALVAAADGTTNALALADAADFRPLYGTGSAARFLELGLAPLDLPNLSADVDSPADLERIAGRVGRNTRAVLRSLRVPA